MNLTLLEFIQCPYCRKGLRFLPFSFSSNNVFPGLFNPRKKAKERLLTWLNKKTASLSRRQKNSDHHQQGILICTQCYRWYPVVNYLPELLPDHLRDWKRDLNILKKAKSSLNPALRKFLKAKANDLNKKALEKTDKGIDFKYSEIHIKDKVDDPCFFGPGYVAPFNPQNPEFTRQLIRRFGHILHLLNLSERATVLDMGTGYAWTAEWLVKAGHQVFGFDICRTYLEIGMERMKQVTSSFLLPELVVADVEYLPFKNDLFDCILCFDSFHHIVDRQKALYQLWRTLKLGGQIVMAEPGPDHEKQPAAIEVMKKYGILEKGMSLDDVRSYAEGLNNTEIKQIFILKIDSQEIDKVATSLSPSFIDSHKFADCNFYLIRKIND